MTLPDLPQLLIILFVIFLIFGAVKVPALGGAIDARITRSRAKGRTRD